MLSHPASNRVLATAAGIAWLVVSALRSAVGNTLPLPLSDYQGRLLAPGALSVPMAADLGEEAGSAETMIPERGMFPLDPVAQIFPCLYQQIAFGDTDQDGRNETFMYVNDNGTFHYRIEEEQGGNVYTDEYSGASLIPYATGDLDEDGRSEVIGQVGYKVYVYESVDGSSYPTELVWSSPDISNVVGYTAIGDTDRDGRQEIIHSLNPFSGNSSLYIFENAGDNLYPLVYLTTVGSGANGEKVIADLDQDGLIEIAFSGVQGQVCIYESPSNNVWVRTFSQSSGLFNTYGAEGGRDSDGNGKPELFIMGNGPEGWTTLVYEEQGDNQFAVIATLTQEDGFIGLSTNALGNLDLGASPEYIMQGSGHFWIYQVEGTGLWEMVQQVDDPGPGPHFAVQTFDVNQNGRDEVFWDLEASIQSGRTTLVLEHAVDPAAVAPPPSERGLSLQLWPNPCRTEARILLPEDADPVHRVLVYAASGQLKARSSLSALDHHRTALWSTEDLSPGVYWLSLSNEAGRTIAGARAVVTR